MGTRMRGQKGDCTTTTQGTRRGGRDETTGRAGRDETRGRYGRDRDEGKAWVRGKCGGDRDVRKGRVKIGDNVHARGEENVRRGDMRRGINATTPVRDERTRRS